jgi:Tfp pilus assembly protein PilO
MKNKRHLIIALTLLAINIAAVALWIYPQLNKASAANKSLFDEKVLLEQQRRKNVDISSLTKQYQKIQGDVEELNEGFIKKENTSIFSLIENIEDISKKNNVSEEVNISPTPTSETDPIDKSTIEITVTGTYANIYSFIAAIDRLPMYISINSIDTSKASDNEQQETVNAKLSGYIYWI